MRSRPGRRCVIVFSEENEKAYRLTETIERAIVRLNVDSQGEFISLINAIQMQFDSMAPVERVVRLLSDAILALAEARGLNQDQLRLGERLETVVKYAASIDQQGGGR